MRRGVCRWVIPWVGILCATADAKPTLQDVQALEEQFKYEEARTLYVQLIEDEPTNAELHYRFGMLFLQRFRNGDKAVAHLQRATELAPQNGQYQLDLASAYGMKFMTASLLDKMSVGANIKKHLELAVACDPNSVTFREGLLAYYLFVPSLAGGGIDKARKEAESIAALDQYSGLLASAWIEARDKKDEISLQHYREALALRPNDPKGYQRLGMYYLFHEKLAEAIGQYKKGVEAAPDNADGWQRLGEAYLKEGLLDEALESLKRSIKLNPLESSAVYQLAKTQRSLRDPIEARNQFQKYLVMDPFGFRVAEAKTAIDELASQVPPAATDTNSPSQSLPRTDVQQASASFFLPVSAAYLAACGGWLLLVRFRPKLWPRSEIPTTNRPWLDLFLAIVAVFVVLGLGQAYRLGYLLPRGTAWLEHLTWTINNVIIFSPVFLLVAIRRQPLSTLFLSPHHLVRKLMIGCVFAALSLLVFQGLRGELHRFPEVLRRMVEPRSLAHFLPVFLEGVILAFLFVRVRWALGSWVALLLPAVLFALAHVPGQFSEGRSLPEMAAFFVLNASLCAAILWVVQRSRDIIWIGVVHYVMDCAIEAFH